MPARIPSFKLFFEIIFLESYAKLGTSEKKAIDKAIKTLADNPRHPSLNIHKAKNVGGKYSTGGLLSVIVAITRRQKKRCNPSRYTISNLLLSVLMPYRAFGAVHIADLHSYST
jgi:hypothetical protein